MCGESDGDAHVGEGVFEDEVPADDPGDEFAQGGVGVGVGRAGDGDHAGEFGVAEAGERADERDEDEREARARDLRRGGRRRLRWVVQPADEEVDDGRVDPVGELGGIAADGGADDREDARPDDDADAERGERDRAERLVQGLLGQLRVG